MPDESPSRHLRLRRSRSRPTSAFFRDADPLGFILFARNVDTPERTRRLVEDAALVAWRAPTRRC